jgi:hypothetical protein
MRATLEGTFAGEPVVTGLGFISNSGLADWTEDAQQLGTELAAALGIDVPPGPFLTPLSVQYKLHMIRIQDLSPGLASSHEWFVNGEGGNITDDALPPFMAMCVTWRTGLKGKQNRGRSYLTGFAEDSQNGGYWISEIQVWANGAFAQPLMDAFGPAGTGNYTLALIHTMSGGTRLVPPTATPIVEYATRNDGRALRRRGVGVRISRHPSSP